MLSTFWFLIKTVAIISALAFIWAFGGDININAYGYDIRMELGAFIILSAVVFYILSLIFRALRKVAATPQTLQEYSHKRNYKTGMQSLTYGLSAVAAGDLRAATHYTNKANRLLADDYGLVALLSGLTARLKGDERQAEKSFKALLNRDETAFLGIRGLLQTALDRQDIRYARVLARQAHTMNPKQPWVIKTLYDLEIRMKDFDAAKPLLKQGVKTKTFTREQAAKDEAAILLHQGQKDRAYKMAPLWLPAILAILPEQSPRIAKKLIEIAWKEKPHPALLDHWITLAPKKSEDNIQKTMAWIEKLYAFNPDNASANLYVAEAAIAFHLNKQSKRFLDKALQIKPTIRVYQLLARIAENESHDYKQAQSWMELAPSAAHDMTWVCTKSGRLYDQWQAFSDNDTYFNAIEWTYPDQVRVHALADQSDVSPFFLTESKAAE